MFGYKWVFKVNFYLTHDSQASQKRISLKLIKILVSFKVSCFLHFTWKTNQIWNRQNYQLEIEETFRNFQLKETWEAANFNFFIFLKTNVSYSLSKSSKLISRLIKNYFEIQSNSVITNSVITNRFNRQGITWLKFSWSKLSFFSWSKLY